jgi:peptidoglycan/LPS O-acetylase OafA/YrhL
MLCWAGVIVSSYILCMTVLTPRGINSALLSNPVLVRAGDISFSIYSVHPFVDSWMRAHVIPESLKGLDCLIAILVGIWVMSEITYRCVEMPCMRLGNALCGKVDNLARRIESSFENGYHQVGMGEEDIDIDDLEVDKRLFERLGHPTYNF